jgi:hypothetical protein
MSAAKPTRHLGYPTHPDCGAEPVTHQINMLRGDGIASTNRAKTHCPQGHPYDEANTQMTRAGGRRCRTCSRNRKR